MAHNNIGGLTLSRPTWSIIIPALNEEKHIGKCLESLCGLSYPKTAFEVILVDNGSQDGTVEIANSFSERLPLQIVIDPQSTVAGVRNTGAAIARGDYLAFLDADCVAPERWLEVATDVFSTHADMVLGAFYDVPCEAAWPAQIWHHFFHAEARGRVTYVPASNILISGDLFRRVGGFDRNLKSNEDGQLCATARQAGADIIAVPELTVTHFGAESTLVQFVRRQFWHGSCVLNPAAVKANRRAIAVGTYTLLCVGWALIQLLSGHFPSKALFALGLLPLVLTVLKARYASRIRDVPKLFTLILCYSLARALALPAAAAHCIRTANRYQRSEA